MYVYWNILVMLMVLPHLRVNPTQKQRGGKTRQLTTSTRHSATSIIVKAQAILPEKINVKSKGRGVCSDVLNMMRQRALDPYSYTTNG